MSRALVIVIALAAVAFAAVQLRVQLADAAMQDPGASDLGNGQQEQAQGITTFEQFAAQVDPMSYINTAPQDVGAANLAAFLLTLRTSEGRGGVPLGYDQLFGFETFYGFDDHPRQARQFTSGGKTLWTSAAGGYQLMAVSPLPGGGTTKVNTWDRIKTKLGLTDFSPASQDAAAVELIDEAGALADVKAGRFSQACDKCKRIWASLPGAGYGQQERSRAQVLAWYQANGGQLEQSA